MLSKTTIPTQSRFAFVDGLRGLAALSIVVFHLWRYQPEPRTALRYAHGAFDESFFRLRGGVQILLVISGFVIAYTLRNTWVTPREVASFVTRRLVRLVPPYWVTLGFVILVDLLCRVLWNLPSPFDGDLSLIRVSAHMAFLQDVFEFDALTAGIWTICIEMQFYIFAILGLWIAQRAFRRPVVDEPRPSAMGLIAVFAPVALVSLFHWRTLESTSPWVIHFAWMFFIGMVAWWTLDRTLTLPQFVSTVLIGLMEMYFDAEWRYENSIALATAVAIFCLGYRRELHLWLNWPWLQYLGRISYSLYLIHFPVCHLLTTAGWKFCADSPTSAQAIAILFASLFVSLFAAHALYTCVEAPSSQLAAKMKKTST